MLESLIQNAIVDGGITFRFSQSENLDDVKEIGGDYWYYPVLPDSTIIVNEHILYEKTKLFISTNAGEIFQPDRYVGIWRNPENGMYYLDINERCVEKTGAMECVKAINSRSNRQIIAIYNPEKDESALIELNKPE